MLKLVKDLVILGSKKSVCMCIHICLDSELLNDLDTLNPILHFIFRA